MPSALAEETVDGRTPRPVPLDQLRLNGVVNLVETTAFQAHIVLKGDQRIGQRAERLVVESVDGFEGDPAGGGVDAARRPCFLIVTRIVAD